MSNPITASSLLASLTLNKIPSSGGASSLTKSPTAEKSAEDKFREYAKMSPADKMRAAILSSMGLTEEQVKNMSPDQQKAVEQKITDQIKQAAQKQAEKAGGGGFFTDIQA
jgi:hypothetical protein